MYGPERLLADLRVLGYKAGLVTADKSNSFAVIRDYVVPLGRFTGRVIDLGIPATADFPRSVGASIHVRATPQLFEKKDSVPDVRNITDSALGTDWRYWSKNFCWTEERTARRLLSQINGIFANA